MGSEGFIHFYLNDFQIIHSGDIKDYVNELKSDGNTDLSNIYIVLCRSKITLTPDSFRMKGANAHFNFQTWIEEDRIEFELSLKFPHFKGDVQLETSYPYNKFTLIDSVGNTITSRPTNILSNVKTGLDSINELLDYEVLYVGQAYGKNGNRTALDRIAKHETLQQILSDCLNNHPDQEIFVLLGDFSYQNMLMSLPHKDYKGKYNETVERSFFEKDNFNIDDKELINVTEAMLIKYFEPVYNQNFKDSFPSKTHTSYSTLYERDIRTIGLEIWVDEMNNDFFSHKVKRQKVHMAKFELQKDKDRFDIFQMK